MASYTGMSDLLADLKLLNLERTEYDLHYFPKSVTVMRISPIAGHFTLSSWPSWIGYEISNKSYQLVTVSSYTDGIDFTFENSGLDVKKVEKLINPYLDRAYHLKKLKSSIFNEMTLYHATTPNNINSICQNNFNWRLNGTSRGHKHGMGVSFSPRPAFSNTFCRSTSDRRIVITKVLYRNSHNGLPHHQLPKPGYDTTKSPNGNVYVKFEDCEFRPVYIVHYD